MKVIFLTHYFPPEVGAPQARMFELAKRLVAEGDQVTVVTGFPNYPTGVVHDGFRGRLAMEEDMEGVRVVRRWVYAAPNAGFARRIANHLSFSASSLTAIRAAGPADVLWVESPPLPLGLAALAYSSLKRAPFVLNVADLWPQAAIELGALRNPAAIRLAEALEKLLYRSAARVTVPTPAMIEDLTARGVPSEKLVHLTNGVDVDAYRPGPWPQGRKVFMYAGTHGLAQGLEVLLEAAKRIGDPEIEIVLAGEGADKAALVAKAERERIANVRFMPNQPRDAMPELLNQAYAAVIPLKAREFLRHARPTKMYESMAVGRPIVAALWGEAADVIEDARCGIVVPPEDPVALASAIQQLAAEPEEARRMGERGRAYVVEHFSRAAAARRLREALSDAVTARAKRKRERRERLVDVAVALPALAMASPLIAVAAIVIKLDSRGPVFFHGPRAGRDGVPFRIHKLRTMRAGAQGPAVTAGDDPRITRAGRVLRRTKLDELPQLFNVVKGEMSLVGPRPEHPDYVAQYTPRQRRLLTVRPGLTGPATLAYIDEEDELRGGDAEARYMEHVMPRKLELELDYLDRATPLSRAAILLGTAVAILRRPSERGRHSRARSRSQPG